MKVKELIEELQKFDPEEDIYRNDSEWGPLDVTHVDKDIVDVQSAGGKMLPKSVPVVF